MRVYDFLLSIASTLGDAAPSRPFRRYTLNDLSAYYTEAMCFVATHRPDLFTDYLVMKLETGASQDARCCGCTNVTEVVAQVNAEGETVTALGGASTSARQSRWFRPTCKASSGSDTVLYTASIDPGMNGRFTVSPPVPPGADVWVKVKCVKNPVEATEATVLTGLSMGDCKFTPALRSYIMYRALQGDRNAVGATNESQAELKNAYTYLGLQYKIEEQMAKASS